MHPVLIGAEIGAWLFGAIFVYTIAKAVYLFLNASTVMLRASLTTNKHPYAHYHPFTRNLLEGVSPELKLAQEALKRGDRETAQQLVDEICALLEVERNVKMRDQLRSKLQRALK